MTVDEAIRAAERVTFGFPFRAWGLRLSARSTHAGMLYLRFRFDGTPHRDTGKPGPLSFDTTVDPSPFPGPRELHRLILTLARDFTAHELSESMLVDGVRTFDPHEQETP